MKDRIPLLFPAVMKVKALKEAKVKTSVKMKVKVISNIFARMRLKLKMTQKLLVIKLRSKVFHGSFSSTN